MHFTDIGQSDQGAGSGFVKMLYPGAVHSLF